MVADANALQGQLFLVLQIRELGIPCMLLLNRMHTTGPSRSELRAEARRLEETLDLPVRVVNAMKDKAEVWVRGWEPLLSSPKACAAIRIVPESLEAGVRDLKPHLPDRVQQDCCAMCCECKRCLLGFPKRPKKHGPKRALTCPVQRRCNWKKPASAWPKSKRFCPPLRRVDTLFTGRLDRVLTHPVWGVLGFGLIFFLMFQAVYSWATVPTDLLDGWMASGMDAVKGAPCLTPGGAA